MKYFIVLALLALVAAAYSATVPEVNNEAFDVDDVIPEGVVTPDAHARVRRGNCPFDPITDTFCRASCASQKKGTGRCVRDGKCQCG